MGETVIATSSAVFQKSTYNALGPARRIIQSKNQSGMYFRRARPNLMLEREDAVARPALDGADQVPGGLFGLDHLDRALIGNVGAHLGSHEAGADGGHRHAAAAQAGPHGLEVGDQAAFDAE